MEMQKRKYNTKRALGMTVIFTIVAYFFLYHQPFSSTLTNMVVFILLMSSIDFTIYQVLKRRKREEGEEE